jgi:hypothetical protein
MKRTALALALSAFAAPLCAGGYFLRLDPPVVTVVVGQTTTIKAIAVWSGITPAPAVYDWTFENSSDPGVASVSGRLKAPDGIAPVTITGLGPGFAGIGQPPHFQVEIYVVCGAEAPIRPAVATLQTTHDKAVTLKLESEIVPRAAITWFAGRVGDTSRRLALGGGSIEFKPTVVGTQYVWAEARTPCSLTTAEFRVDVTAPRRRSVR